MDIANVWLESGLPALIRGVRLVPKKNPKYDHIAYSEEGKQGVAYHLVQSNTTREWILKRFQSGKLPDHQYLVAVRSLVPGGIAFKAASKRVVLSSSDLKCGDDLYSSNEFSKWINETILMPRMPGYSWKTITEQIRSGAFDLQGNKRIALARSLAEAVRLLEDNGCAHRDLSHQNVFLDMQEYVVYLVDWDSLFHGSLYYHKNTPPGTEGYMAPWVLDKDGCWDSRKSWNRKSDRFSLAILVAEFLLVEKEAPTYYEGALFSQEILANPRHAFNMRTLESLYSISEGLGDLFRQTITATSYDECPPPSRWQEILEDGNLNLPTKTSGQSNEVVSQQPQEDAQTPPAQRVQQAQEAPEAEQAESEEEYEIASSLGLAEEESTGVNYWLLLMILLIPLMFWVIYQVRERYWIPSQQNQASSEPIKAQIPTTEIKSNNPGQPAMAEQYTMEIPYAGDDLKMQIQGKDVSLNKDNMAIVTIEPGSYDVSLTFTGVIHNPTGDPKRTPPTTVTQKVKFEKNKTIKIRINREENKWEVDMQEKR